MADIKWSSFTNGGNIASGDEVVGLRSGANVRMDATSFETIDIDNININGNIISSTDTNGNIQLNANGTGQVEIDDPGLETSGILVDGASYETAFRVNDIGGSAPAQVILHRHSTTWEPILLSARSNSDTSSHTAVTNGMSVLTMYGAGWVGSYYGTMASITMSADSSGTIGTGSAPGRIELKTTPNGSLVPVTALSINNAGTVTLASALPVASGGTGATTVGSSGTLAQSNGSTYSFTTATYPSTATTSGTMLRANGTNWVASTSTFADTYSASSLLYSNGANTVTGLSTANSATLVTSSAGVPSWTSSMTNGQVLIGSTGATPTPATLTAGTNISITNAAGSITIAGTGVNSGTANQLAYYASSGTQVSGLTTANSGLLVTSATGVPSIGTAILADITINGVTAGLGASSVSTNAAFGTSALAANTSGSNAVAFGYEALKSQTTATSNAGFGYQALTTCTSGGSNTGIGVSALRAVTNSSNNTALGGAAGFGLTTGAGNTFLGRSSGTVSSPNVTITTGSNNTFVGYASGATSATAAGTIAIGYLASADASTGSTSGTNGPSIAIGSTSAYVGFRGDNTAYTTAGASAGYWRVKINGTFFKLQIYADS